MCWTKWNLARKNDQARPEPVRQRLDQARGPRLSAVRTTEMISPKMWSPDTWGSYTRTAFEIIKAEAEGYIFQPLRAHPRPASVISGPSFTFSRRDAARRDSSICR